MTPRKVIYIAGPFRARVPGKDPAVQDAWGIQTNVMRAMDLALKVWQAGAVALCPHANTMFFQNAYGVDDSIWLDGDLELLKRSDAVLLVSGWESSTGAKAEVEYAVSIGKPVFYTMREAEEWLSTQR